MSQGNSTWARGTRMLTAQGPRRPREPWAHLSRRRSEYARWGWHGSGTAVAQRQTHGLPRGRSGLRWGGTCGPGREAGVGAAASWGVCPSPCCEPGAGGGGTWVLASCGPAWRSGLLAPDWPGPGRCDPRRSEPVDSSSLSVTLSNKSLKTSESGLATFASYMSVFIAVGWAARRAPRVRPPSKPTTEQAHGPCSALRRRLR